VHANCLTVDIIMPGILYCLSSHIDFERSPSGDMFVWQTFFLPRTMIVCDGDIIIVIEFPPTLHNPFDPFGPKNTLL
jgi:hypothetical protein